MGRLAQRDRDLVDQQFGELGVRALQGLANLIGTQGRAEPGAELFGHPGRRHVGILDAEQEHRVVHRLGGRQCFPGAVQQLGAPALEEVDLGFRDRRRRARRLVTREGPGPGSLGRAIVVDQVNQGGLQVIAEAAAAGIGMLEGAPEYSQRELL